MRHSYTIFALFLFVFSTRTYAQQLVANINQSNAGSSPTRLMGNDEYGAFFARSNGGPNQLFYLLSGENSLNPFRVDLPFIGSSSIWDSRLIGKDVYVRTYDAEGG